MKTKWILLLAAVALVAVFRWYGVVLVAAALAGIVARAWWLVRLVRNAPMVVLEKQSAEYSPEPDDQVEWELVLRVRPADPNATETWRPAALEVDASYFDTDGPAFSRPVRDALIEVDRGAGWERAAAVKEPLRSARLRVTARVPFVATAFQLVLGGKLPFGDPVQLFDDAADRDLFFDHYDDETDADVAE